MPSCPRGVLPRAALHHGPAGRIAAVRPEPLEPAMLEHELCAWEMLDPGYGMNVKTAGLYEHVYLQGQKKRKAKVSKALFREEP